MLASHFAQIRLLHMACVTISGTLFTVRGLLRIADVAGANHWILRMTSYVNDTLLLIAAVLLAVILHQYPFVDAWLTAKFLLLLVYIVLGSYALKRARTRVGRIAALFAALVTFGYIIGVAITHQPQGWLLWIRR